MRLGRPFSRQLPSVPAIKYSNGRRLELFPRREQKAGLLGGMSFLLNVRAENTDRELISINKYKPEDLSSYSRREIVDPRTGLGVGIAPSVQGDEHLCWR